MKHKNITYLVTFLFISGFWIVLITYALLVSVGETPISINNGDKLYFSTFLPEGWAFFTRSPKEDEFLIYKITEDDLENSIIRNASAETWWGLNRNSRIQGVEISKILNQLNHWSDFSGDNNNLYSMKDTMPCDTFTNKFNAPSLCGEYIVQRRKHIPWAWATIDYNQPSTISKIYLICTE